MEGKSISRLKQKGMTLVELVVVIAILGAFIGYMGYQVSVTNGFKARECNKKIATAITELKVRTLSKAAKTGDIYMEIYKGADSAFYQQVHYAGSVVDDPVQVGKKRITVQYLENGIWKNITDTNKLVICFNRSSGAMVEKTASYPVSKVTAVRAVYGKTYTTELVPATGKVVQTG